MNNYNRYNCNCDNDCSDSCSDCDDTCNEQEDTSTKHSVSKYCGCPGPQGPIGPKGDMGLIGPKGDTGLTGPKGDTGLTGPKGDTGLTGPKGDTGLTGSKGDTGLIGPQGVAGLQGPQGLTGDIGAQGPVGPKGDTGLTGPKGDMGLIGPAGTTGATGPQGIAGPKGDSGLQGPKGDTGAIGPRGDTGAVGSQGPTGATGPQGPTGPKGDSGATGATGPQGPTGMTGSQGPVGPKGDPGCCCCQPGPTGATGLAGAAGATGAQGAKGDPGATICPCAITFGKVVDFLLENEFPFTASIDTPFDYFVSSSEDAPAILYNTWAVEFEEEIIVPLCELEAIYLTFNTEQERDTFVSLLRSILNQTLSCCHNCGTCEICPETLFVDQFNSIVDMPSSCNYEYYLDGECNCLDSQCDVIARRIDLCSFVNTSGEKLRQIIERKEALDKTVALISTHKSELIPTELVKNIEATGLSTAVLSYENEGTYDIAIVCLEKVTAIQFEDEILI